MAAATLLIVALAYGLEATTFDVAFMADPLGPKAAPLLLAGVLAVLAIWLLVRPGSDGGVPPRESWRRLAIMLVATLAYALLLETLGFVLATTLVIIALALPLGGRPLPSLLAAAGFATAAYYLFVFVLDVPLPIGRIFPFLGG